MIDLYNDYLAELSRFAPMPLGEGNRILESYKQPYYQTYSILFEGREVGFFIIGTAPDCHPDCDYFICQAYITPSERGHHRMKNSIRFFVNQHPGTYCLDILDGNNVDGFWKNVFDSLGYKQIKLQDVPHGYNIHTLYFTGGK